MSSNYPLSATDFMAVFDKSPVAILLIATDAPQYTIIEVNEAYLKSTNSNREALIGRSVFGAFPANPTDEVSKNIERTIYSFEEAIRTSYAHTMYNYRYDIPIPGTNEFEERYWTTSNTPVLDEAGNVKFLIHSPLNVTEVYQLAERERLAVDALKIQRKQLYAIFMQAPVGIGIIKGPDHVVDLINPPMSLIYGKSLKEMRGKSIFETLPSIKGLGFEELLDYVRLTGLPYYGNEVPVPLLRNGEMETVYVDFVYEPFREEDNTISGVIVVAIDITDRIKSKLKLKESEAQFRFMAESMPQQVWTANANGALDYVNERSQDYFGQDAGAIIGAGWQAFIHPDDLACCLKHWTEALKTNNLYQVEFRLRRGDGEYRWHLARALPFKMNDTVIKWLGTNTDIEEHKKLEHQKDEFISIASHELKTPLTSLKAYLQLLDRPPGIAGTPGQFIKSSVQQVKRLEKLVSDLLDVSKISAGKMIYNMASFPMDELVNEVVQNVQLANARHHLTIISNPPVTFEGDRYRLEQVLTNFLTNAVKYSPDADEVLISSVVEHDSIVVAVRDFGIGIEKENLDKLFNRFYRVDNTAMKYEGLGLGLYVSAEILNRHKGNFWIESQLGKGSTFYFRLPLRQQPGIKQDNTITTLFEAGSVTIMVNEAEAMLEVDWKGFHNYDSVKAGTLKVVDTLTATGYSKILNNNNNLLGSWADATEWVGTIAFPLLEKAGLRHMAWVYSLATFSQLAAEKSINLKTSNVITQTFCSMQDGRVWLKSV